jgi:hypothetical protein
MEGYGSRLANTDGGTAEQSEVKKPNPAVERHFAIRPLAPHFCVEAAENPDFSRNFFFPSAPLAALFVFEVVNLDG